MTLTNFQFYKPCKELQPYIRYYWVFKSNQPLNTLTFPIGCPQIIFHKQTPLYIPELRTVQSEFTVSGQVNYPSHFYADGNVEMIVVVFYQEVGQFQCVGNGSLFSHTLCILLVHIELHKMCDLQTAGSHLIVCNSIFVYHAVLQCFARIICLQTHPGENVLTAYNPCHNTFQVHL